MPEKSKPAFNPAACFDHDSENYYVQIELPGVKRQDIQLSVSEQSLCVRGSREDVDLLGCWFLADGVDEEGAKVRYENGLLSVVIPLRKLLKGIKVPIE